MDCTNAIHESSPLLGDSSTSEKREQRQGKCRRLFCCRNVLVVLQFVGFVTVYGMRANLSVALVAMVNQTYAEQTSGRVLKPECMVDHGNSTDDTEDGKFQWDQKTQGLILGSFFYGYMATQLPGGWLAGQYGGKNVLGFGILLTAVFSMLTPIAARTHLYFLMAVRVFAGIGEGVTYPAATVLWSRWSSPLERSGYLVFSFTGGDFGAIMAMPISGYLSSLTEIDDGWPLAFYVFGALGVIWFFVWMGLAHDSPAEHPRIEEWEKHYIETGIGHSQNKVIKKIPVPWLSILTSVPLWAAAMVGFTYGWGWYMFLTGLPSFFKEVLDFNIKTNGVLSALPFVATLIIKNSSAQLSDWLQVHRGMSTTAVRKMFGCTAFLIAAALLVPVGFLGCSSRQVDVSVLLLILSCGALGIYAPMGSTNSVDLSPRFAGVTMGIFNTVSNIPGILTPAVIGILTNNEPTRGQWRKLFYITCGIYGLGAICYLIFGSGKEQPWNTPREMDDEQDGATDTNVVHKELWRTSSIISDDDDLNQSVASSSSIVPVVV